jgi:putative ATPase
MADILLLNCSHPVYNQYLPPEFVGKEFLKKEGDMDDKLWDEAELQKWEEEMNEGEKWKGRP